ncbi:GAP family protein [Streptomyces sp. NPDC057445]|uniref:GAP family protein n=1 Tax=Streptomyces sp. NPDC057445 TaxID=3346136 RepID=UPI003679E0C2
MVLDLLLIGIAINIDPLPLMAFVLVLSAPKGIWKGLAFILAWLACLVAVIAAVLLLTGGQPPPPRSPPSTAGLAAKLAIGVALVLYAEYKRRHRGVPHKRSSSPTSRMDQVSPWSAAALAVFLQPWGMVAAAATVVVEADLSHLSSYLALFGFCVLATATLLAAELYTVFSPEAAAVRLKRLRAWLHRHQDPAVVVACLLLGLWLVGNSIYQLTS